MTILLCAASAAAAEFPLSGVDYWAGVPRHPAVVNSVTAMRGDAFSMSLRGEWEYAIGGHGNGWRNWGFQFAEDWPVSGKLVVPGCWEKQGIGAEAKGESFLCQDRAEKTVRHFFRGEVWYRRRVEIPEQWRGRRIWFKTGGFRSRGWVWVNDNPVAWVESFCSTLKYDITPFVKPGESAKIVVCVDNAVSPRNVQMNCVNRWGGIWRDIELEATAPTFIDDAWARGDFDRREAEVHVDLCVAAGRDAGDFSVRVDVEGRKAQTPAGSTNLVLRVPFGDDFRPWSPEHPNLYTARVDLVEGGRVVQSRCERFGVRKLEVRGREFYLNGRPFFVRGFGDDSSYPIDGLTPPDREFHLAHLRTAHEAGFNFVRLHTHCELPEYFEAADEAGIIVQPELSYYMDNPEDDFGWDPMSDLAELWRNYRRYASFGVYSCGNEGTIGKFAGKAVGDWIRAHDPDRLYIEEDGGTYLLDGHGAGRTTHCSGPLAPWERGSFNPPRPFICHEYLNLCVKADSRTEGDYTGAYMPPVTRKDREWWLRRHGLDMEWGDLLQDSAHALQGFWQKQGVEHARMDPYCDGFCFWTIADVVVRNEVCETYSAQGLFDQFWRRKRCGLSAAEFAEFNSPSCILLDNEGRGDRVYRENTARSLLNDPWGTEAVREGTNRVYVSGGRIPADFLLAHYGEDAIDGVDLEWEISSGGRRLGGGSRPIGRQEIGPVRLVARESIEVPEIPAALQARLAAHVGAVSNHWDIWIFPRREPRRMTHTACEERFLPRLSSRYPGLVAVGSPAAAGAKTVIAAEGSAAMSDALAAGKTVIALENQEGPANIALGWWNIGAQCGTAMKPHPALKNLPCGRLVSPLFFRILKTGAKLLVRRVVGTDVPIAAPPRIEDVIIAGEGGDACYYYLAATEGRGGGRCFHVAGLDVLSDTPEGTALLDGILDAAAQISDGNEKQTGVKK